MPFVLKPIAFQLISVCVGWMVGAVCVVTPIFAGLAPPNSNPFWALVLFAFFLPILFAIGSAMDFAFLILGLSSRTAFIAAMTIIGALTFAPSAILFNEVRGSSFYGNADWQSIVAGFKPFWLGGAVAALVQSLLYWQMRQLEREVQKIKDADAQS